MSYKNFSKCKIGTVKELIVDNGAIKFVKSGSHQWLVVYAVRTTPTFVFTRFTTVLSEIEASHLFDVYSK